MPNLVVPGPEEDQAVAVGLLTRESPACTAIPRAYVRIAVRVIALCQDNLPHIIYNLPPSQLKG